MGFIDAVRDLAQQAGLTVPEDDSSPGEREQAARAEAAAGDPERRARQGGRALPPAAEGQPARDRLPEGPRPERRDRRALRPRLRARRLARPGQRLPELRRPAARGKRPGHRAATATTTATRPTASATTASATASCFRSARCRATVIGFGGRVLDRGEPKYLNSPETPVFVKGRELYGLFEARTAHAPARLRAGRRGLHGRGRAGAVGLRATRSRRSARPAPPSMCRSCFASPTRSSSASTATPPAAAPPARALEASLPHASDTRSVRFLFLPPEHDPDRYVRELGAEAFEQRVAEAVPLSRQLVDAAPAKGCDLATAEGRARILANGQAAVVGPARRHAEAPAARRARRRAARWPADELAARWRAGGAARGRPRRAGDRRRPRRRRRGARSRQRRCRQPPTASPGCCCCDSDLVGRARAPPTTHLLLRPARLARRAVPLPRPRSSTEHGAAALGGAARTRCAERAAGRRRGAGAGRRARIRRSSRSLDDLPQLDRRSCRDGRPEAAAAPGAGRAG